MIPKFRAYFKQYKRMIENVGIVNQNMILVDFNNGGNFESLFVTDKIHVMQSTGLFDKNGVEIYEGDIVRNIQTNSVGKVFWDIHNVGYYYSVKRKNTELFEHFTLFNAKNKLEVIGNIYENKDLLEE